MAQPYIGEIRMFAGNFAPAGWAFCDGQLIPIAENDALFTLIGTTYGGDGEQTFALPNLQSRVPIHQGQGPGLSNNYILGETGGVEEVTLSINQIPQHSHIPQASNTGGSDNPANNFWAHSTLGKPYAGAPPTVQMNAGTILPAGSSQPHENMIPFLCVTYIISLFGVFPTQS
jgi:microcystin-dependent protein